MTGALNQRLRPLGHAILALLILKILYIHINYEKSNIAKGTLRGHGNYTHYIYLWEACWIFVLLDMYTMVARIPFVFEYYFKILTVVGFEPTPPK